MTTRPERMTGAVLPGNSTVELRTFDVPLPGHGEVLLRTKSSTICGSDIRCIYHQHLGKGPEGYQPGMIAGHEPCGQIVGERAWAAVGSRRAIGSSSTTSPAAACATTAGAAT